MSNVEKSDSSSRDGVEVSNVLHTAEQRKTDSDFRDANSYGNSATRQVSSLIVFLPNKILELPKLLSPLRQEHGTMHGSGDQQVYTEQTTIPIAYMEGSRGQLQVKSSVKFGKIPNSLACLLPWIIALCVFVSLISCTIRRFV